MQYAGKIIESCSYEGKNAHQIATGIITATALELSKKDTGYDLFIAKPLLRAVIEVLESRKNEILSHQDALTEQDKAMVETVYGQTIKTLHSIVLLTKE